jgi:hypothetical protein
VPLRDSTLGRKYLEDSFAEAEQIEDIEIMAQVGHGLCISYQMAGEFTKLVDIAPKIIALLEKTHRESEFFGSVINPYSIIQNFYGITQAYLGEFRTGDHLAEKALSFAHSLKGMDYWLDKTRTLLAKVV